MIHRVEKKMKALCADPQLQDVARNTLAAFVLKISGAALTFAFNVTVARLLGAEGTGIYFLALAVTTIASVIGRFGLDNTLVRFVATRAAQEDWAGVKGVVALGMRMAGAGAGVMTLIIFFAAPWIGEVLLEKPLLAEPLRWMSLSIIPLALLNLQAESLKGLTRIPDAMFVQGVGLPLLGLLLIVPLAQASGVLGVGFAYVGSALFVTGVGGWRWHRALSVYPVAATPFPFKEIWVSCRPLWGVSILNGAVLPWLPLFLLGVWSTSEEVGMFGAALRVAMLVSFFLIAVNNVVAPKFAALYARGEIESLGKVARQSALLLTVLANPIFMIMILAGNWVMGLYGSGFSDGGRVLAILAVGQLINACCGPVGTILMMSGHEQKVRNSTLLALLFQLSLCVGLIPRFGMEGAAIATATGIIVFNLLAVWYVRHLIGLAYPFNFGGKAG